MPPGKRRTLSGAYWVSWVKTYAPTSAEIKDLKGSFQTGVTEFKRALENATPKGAVVVVSHTYRSDQAAYLWHWAWKIANRKSAPKDATPYALPGRPVPEIEWDHGNLNASIKAAEDMLKGFELTKNSPFAPSLTTRHRDRLAIDLINGSPLLREWVDDPNTKADDLDAITLPDEQAWLAERVKYLLY